MQRFHHFAELGSTNDWLAQRADELADDSWAIADIQTAGRGRRGRPWASLPGNLMASVLVRPQPGEGPPQQLAFAAALAAHEALLPLAGRTRLSLKWPNDLLLGGAKCAGILLERAAGVTIAGFGINLAREPTGTGQRVAAFASARADIPSPAAFLPSLADAFTRWRARWRAEGFAPVRARWLSLATPVGWALTVRLEDGVRSGVFAGMAADGALLLERPDGVVETLYAGDVSAG